MPELYIITGSNGAGKSSVGPDYLPAHIRDTCGIFDGDLLFMRKRSELYQSGIRSHKECKKLAYAWLIEHFESLVTTAIENKQDFVYEGHFTNHETWEIPRRFKAAGFEIHLIFLGLTDTGTSELRVVARTKEGGHYVDPPTVAANFYGNMEMLDKYYGIFDSVQLFDTTTNEHRYLATLENGLATGAVNAALLPEWFTSAMPAITNEIKGMEGSL